MVEDHGDGRGGDGQRIAVGRGDPVTTPRGAEQIFSLRVLIGRRRNVKQALHQRSHHIFVIGQGGNLLRRRARPVNNQRHLQLLARPVERVVFRIQRLAVAAGNNYHRIIEFAGFAQRSQHPIDLGINVACRLAVAADKALLLRVVESGAIERDPREPAILILRVTVQPADPLIGRLLVALGLRARQREIGEQRLAIQRAAKPIGGEEAQLVALLVEGGNQRGGNTRREDTVHIARRNTVEQAKQAAVGGIARAHMLGKVNVFFGKCRQRRHGLFKPRVVQVVDGDQQHVVARAEVTVAQVAKRILDRYRLRRPLLHQTTLIILGVEQAMFLKETTGGHRIGERQIRPLHSDRAIEIGVRPDIDQVAADERQKEEPGDRAGVMAAARQAAQLLPAPGGEEHFNQEDDRDADKHQLPVARHLILVRVDDQLPDDRV